MPSLPYHRHPLLSRYLWAFCFLSHKTIIHRNRWDLKFLVLCFSVVNVLASPSFYTMFAPTSVGAVRFLMVFSFFSRWSFHVWYTLVLRALGILIIRFLWNDGISATAWSSCNLTFHGFFLFLSTRGLVTGLEKLLCLLKVIITIQLANLLVHWGVSGTLSVLSDLDIKKEAKGAINTIKWRTQWWHIIANSWLTLPFWSAFLTEATSFLQPWLWLALPCFSWNKIEQE